MNKPKVCIYIPIDDSKKSHRELEIRGCEVTLGSSDWKSGIEQNKVLEIAKGANALMGATIKKIPIDRMFLEHTPDLRIISKYTIGFEDIDLDAATDKGILVTNSPTEANWGGVAEGTIALMLSLTKKIGARDHHVKSGGWRDDNLMGTYLGKRDDGYKGVTIGIIGLGRVGSRVADLLYPWNIDILAYDPYLPDSVFSKHKVKRVDLDDLLKSSDIISIHCNLTNETRNMFNKENIEKMKKTAYLVNTARGPIIDIDALTSSLDSGNILGAALDVLPEEPPPENSYIRNIRDNLILSPHMVSANYPGTLVPAIPGATKAILDSFSSLIPENICNKDAIPKWKDRFGNKPLIKRIN